MLLIHALPLILLHVSASLSLDVLLKERLHNHGQERFVSSRAVLGTDGSRGRADAQAIPNSTETTPTVNLDTNSSSSKGGFASPHAVVGADGSIRGADPQAVPTSKLDTSSSSSGSSSSSSSSKGGFVSPDAVAGTDGGRRGADPQVVLGIDGSSAAGGGGLVSAQAVLGTDVARGASADPQAREGGEEAGPSVSAGHAADDALVLFEFVKLFRGRPQTLSFWVVTAACIVLVLAALLSLVAAILRCAPLGSPRPVVKDQSPLASARSGSRRSSARGGPQSSRALGNKSSIPAPSEGTRQEVLCPLLVVPAGLRLNCIVQNDVCHRKQEIAFNIRGAAGASLFQVRVAELSGDRPGIHVETLGGGEQLAFLSTAELWRGGGAGGGGAARMQITSQSGLPYGRMWKRQDTGEYVVERDGAVLLAFCGDFGARRVRVQGTTGAIVAVVSQENDDEYSVVVHTGSDAGLVILGLLAIDKCEARSPAPGSHRSLASLASEAGSVVALRA